MKDENKVPVWYTKKEMYDYLICQQYSKEIATELSEKWADDLQGAFAKGYQKKFDWYVIDSLERGMSEYFRMHDYRSMYGLFRNFIDNLKGSCNMVQPDTQSIYDTSDMD